MVELQQRRVFRKNDTGKQRMLIFAALIVVVICYGIFAIFRQIPATISISQPTQSLTTTNLAWPSAGSSAVGIVDGDSISCKTYGATTARPTASIAKIITVLTVLQKYPLTGNETGPTITISAQDVDFYQNTVANGGSNLPVALGEKLTEKQLLEGIMLESSDNMADTLANWAFGDFAKYKTAAQKFLAAHDLRETTIGSDASGLDPATTSTPNDLCHLMSLALQNSTLAAIMGTSEISNFPLGNNETKTIKNTNKALGQTGIFAGKTGSLGTGYYNLVSAAHVQFDGRTVTVVMVVMGQENFAKLFAATETLSSSIAANLSERGITAGQVVGTAKSPDGSSVELVAKNSLPIATLNDQKVTYKTTSKTVNLPISSGEVVGKITDTASSQSVDIIAKSALSRPNPVWLVTRP